MNIAATIEILTDAPEVYDGFGTKTIGIVGTSKRHGGNAVRRVAIERDHFEWQTGRYASGSYYYTSERCPVESWVRFGDWVLS